MAFLFLCVGLGVVWLYCFGCFALIISKFEVFHYQPSKTLIFLDTF